jgi:hypothetical protein
MTFLVVQSERYLGSTYKTRPCRAGGRLGGPGVSGFGRGIPTRARELCSKALCSSEAGVGLVWVSALMFIERTPGSTCHAFCGPKADRTFGMGIGSVICQRSVGGEGLASGVFPGGLPGRREYTVQSTIERRTHLMPTVRFHMHVEVPLSVY